jgi:hypothetical protein
VTACFDFGDRRRLAFSPEDTLAAIYRSCYPLKWFPDALELETLAHELKRQYGIDLYAVWDDRLTLGEVFARVRIVRM